MDVEGELVFNTGIQSTRKHREYTVKKSIVSIVLLSGAVLLASATPAMAAHVGIGINIGVPGYYPAPVYVQPAPVYMPPPVYVQPAPVYVRRPRFITHRRRCITVPALIIVTTIAMAAPITVTVITGVEMR